MNTLPPNLPDERTAQRLLDLLGQVENLNFSKVLQAHSVPAEPVASPQLSRLESENRSLREQNARARERLLTLAQRLEEQEESEEMLSEEAPEKDEDEARQAEGAAG